MRQSQLHWVSLTLIAPLLLLLGCPYGDRFSEVAGFVLDSAGQPVAGAHVNFDLMRQDSLVQSDSAHTRQDGAFVFVVDGGLDGNRAILRASSEGRTSKVEADIYGRGSSGLRVTFTLPTPAASAP